MRRRGTDAKGERKASRVSSIYSMYHGQSIMLILFFAETMALIVQHRVPQAIHMCAAAAKPASAMRVKELKEELDLLGVEWRGVIFEKETLEEALY